MAARMTDLGMYNVGKSDTGRFVVMCGSDVAPFLGFDKYKDCLDKVVKLNSNARTVTAPKYKKLFKTNSRGKTCAAPPHRTLIG